MEPSSSSSARLHAATTWATGTTTHSAATAAGGSSLHARAVLQFAEKRQYRELLHAIQLRPELAAASDALGMMPLHWLCSDRDVPLRALQQLVLAYPTATTVRNLAGLLPLHMAVRKDLSLDALKTVLKFYPKAIVAATPDGKTPMQLAQDHVTSREARHFLRQLDQEVHALGRVPPPPPTTTTTATSSPHDSIHANNNKNNSNNNNGGDDDDDPAATAASANKKAKRTTTTTATTTPEPRAWEDGYPVAIVDASAVSHEAATHRSLDERALAGGVGTRPLPPVWKLNTSCYICETKFGYFKKRHHCRNCGESVCGRHSRHSLPLKHLGLFHAQRVCSGCHARLQSHYTSRALARLSPHSASAAGRLVEDAMLEEHVARPHSPQHARHARSRSAHAMTFAHEAQQHPLLSPRVHHMQTPSPLVITPPPSTRTTRSATMSPRSARTASSTTIRSAISNASAATTTATTATTTAMSSRYQPNFIKMPSGFSMHITHVQRTDDQLTVLERQREMQRRRDRLANTDLETYAWQGRDSETSNPLTNQDQDEDNALLLEMQMEKLTLAKKQIRDALQRSKRDADSAQDEKDKYEELAKAYEQRGYAYSPESADDKQEAGPNGTFVDSDSGGDDNGSDTSSVVATKYGYAAGAGNQHQDDSGDDSIAVNGAAQHDHQGNAANNYDGDDGDTSAVYGLVPETKPGEAITRAGPSLPFEKDDIDMPLDLAATYHDLGVVLLTKGDFINATIELQKALDLNAENAQTWYHLAKALDGKGESAEAEKAIQKSLEFEPHSLPSLSLLGKLLNARGEHDEAILVYRRALNLQCPRDSSPVVQVS